MIQAAYRVASLPSHAPVAWSAVEPIHVAHFHPRSSNHRPTTTARLAHCHDALLLRFDVQDHYVVARHTVDQQQVCEDSCVEFFLQPSGAGYFNFEFNCSGVMLVSYVHETPGDAGAPRSHTLLTAEQLSAIQVASALSGKIDPEREGPTDWWLEAHIPNRVLESYTRPLGRLRGQQMTGNFFKCADRCSHPHWASWNPIGEALNFHQPCYFGVLQFA